MPQVLPAVYCALGSALDFFAGAAVQVVEMIFFGASQRGLVYLYRDVLDVEFILGNVVNAVSQPPHLGFVNSRVNEHVSGKRFIV